MSYIVEVAFDVKKIKNIIPFKTEIVNNSKKYNCNFFYLNHEMMGSNRKIYRNHYILTFHIPENDENMLSFIRYLTSIKDLHIESIGFDNCQFKLMYASKKYLKFMDEYCVKKYLTDRNEKNLYKQNSKFMKILHKQ